MQSLVSKKSGLTHMNEGKNYILTCSMVTGSIWHATVRDQIRVYSFKESSSSTPTSIAESNERNFYS